MSSANSNLLCSATLFATQTPPKTYEQLLDECLDNDSDTDDIQDIFNSAGASGQDSSGDTTGSPPFQDVNENTSEGQDLDTPQRQKMMRVIVDHAVRRAKLQPYQLDKVDVFLHASMTTQLGLLFVNIQAVKSEVNRVLVNQPHFTVDKALHKTILAYSLGVLLSNKLREYKRSSTDVVLAIIRGNNTNIPSNLDQDPYAMSTIKVAISNALTQGRSWIKKLIGKSIDKNQSIYNLASKIIEGSQCTVSIPLCAQLSVLRYVYTDRGSGLTYWNDVDMSLAQGREKAKGNSDGIQKILGKMLKHDRATYGSKDNTSIPKDVSCFQRVIDDSL